MEATTFIRNFIKYPDMIGAVWPSSKFLAKKMITDVNFENAKCIVEYGPGTGIFTNELIKNKKENTILLVLELNKELYNTLEEKYSNIKNVHIINDTAENVGMYVNQYGFECADYIISGLPFTAFPEELSKSILTNTLEILNKEGKFITFQYTLLKKNFMKKFFPSININFEMINIPPAFVFSCSKEK
ncbi:SAM-dependent methyltransferase [Clostridium aestuarii]|uniref:SAM-dependent methyltransferase n=1 Tax=Clostridium aestuarii TaxID=338193 RepID=A0ABT4D3G1_9CLOT|nr:rRNA adenine N-6-methyltransferase family protein [Clostridium aestuarii]MCY6485773.1 SAM-dependent methyltransferase [Clostridium aestuarii]